MVFIGGKKKKKKKKSGQVAILRWLKKKKEWPGGPLCTGFNLITSLY
jgi:hypothetical protein